MSETTPAEAVESADIERAAMSENLQTAADLLTGWFNSRDSDSIRTQNHRKAVYAEACRTLESLPSEAKELGLELSLTVGTEPIKLVRLSRNAYDLVERKVGPELQRGESIQFNRSENVYSLGQSYESRVTHLYLSGPYGILEVAGIAEVLANGGQLELVERATQ